MSVLRNRTEKCGIEAVFTGGSLNGQVRWVDKPDAYLVTFELTAPDGDGVLYAPQEIYKLRSTNPSPLQYEALWTKPN